MDANTTPTDAEVLTEAETEAIFREASEARDAAREGREPEAQADPEPKAAEVAAEPTKGAPAPTPAAPAAAQTSAPAPASSQPAAAPPAKAKSLEEMTPAELLEHAKQKEHERQSAVGRQVALQRELDGLKRARPTAAPKPELPEAERLEQAFPELKKAVEFEVETRLSKEQQARAQALQQERLNIMEATFPGWATTMQGEQFNYWLGQQPADVQAKIHSDSVADYATLLRGFEKASAQPPTTAPAAGPTEADRLKAERATRLAQSKSMPTGRPSVGGNTSGAPDAETDPDGYFNWLSAARDRKAQGARR